MQLVRRFGLHHLLLAVGALGLIFAIAAESNRRLSISRHESALAISPDGRTLAVASSNLPVFQRAQNVLLIDLPTRRCTRLLVEALWVHDVAFSPDGRLLASAHSDGTVRLWDVDTHQEVRRIVAARGEVVCVAFSPDGKALAAGGDAAALGIWDIATGQQLAELQGHAGRVLDIAYSDDGLTLASATEDRMTRLWETTTERVRVTVNTRGVVDAIAFTPDGRLALSGSVPRAVELRDARSGAVTDQFPLKQGQFTSSVAISSDGRTLAAGHQGRITLWDTDSRQRLMTLEGHAGRWVDSLVFTPSGETLISGSRDGVVVAWDIPRRRQAAVLAHDPRRFPWALTFFGLVGLGVTWYGINKFNQRARGPLPAGRVSE